MRRLAFPTVRFHSGFALRVCAGPVVFFEWCPLFVEGVVACDRQCWNGWFTIHDVRGRSALFDLEVGDCLDLFIQHCNLLKFNCDLIIVVL